MNEPLPVVDCPTCGTPITVVSDYCITCGSTFVGRELWEHYETSHRGNGVESAKSERTDGAGP